VPATIEAPARYADAGKLQGIQKAAVLMVTLGEERAAEIFNYLSQTEVEAL
jgi:flagellar motor switch protein FliG